MDAKSIGAQISKLRRRCSLTQAQLAARLHISDKTVSRWESGIGFPEVTQFPALAEIFGVTVDYLMTGERKGIAVAGNILANIVKNVDLYPALGMLGNITDMKQAVGGCATNTAINLAKIDRNIPLSVIGKIGNDEYGRFILSVLSRYGIDCEQISLSSTKPTGFSDVVVNPTGERTFFYASGANGEFSPEDVDTHSLNCVVLHIGYILLLDLFDKEDAVYGTVMARFLHDLQEKGIRTSVDVMSDSHLGYKEKVIPALRYCDYAIMNEKESCSLTDLPPTTPDGKVNVENIRKTAEFMAGCGVRNKVIIHCKQACFCYDAPSGSFTAVPALDIPREEIRGSVGAGDAFSAGCLYGIYKNYNDTRLLEFASAAAASVLFCENSTDGMLDKNQLEKLEERYGRKTL